MYSMKSKKDPDLNLIICGDGEEKDDLIKLIQKLKLENNVKLVGFKKNIYPILLELNYLF